MNKSVIQLIVFIGIICLSSCDRSQVFYDTVQLDGNGWSYAEDVVFDIPIDDTTSSYQISVVIDHTEDYEYQNIYLKATETSPDGHSVSDTISIQLADKSGHWIGKSKGGSFETEGSLKKIKKFGTSGRYNLKLEQFSRKEVLQGVQSVGLRISKIE